MEIRQLTNVILTLRVEKHSYINECAADPTNPKVEECSKIVLPKGRCVQLFPVQKK